MQNYDLLRQLAKAKKPILLKRGPSASVKEWLLAAEYLLAGGNDNVVLCERGIKTFESEMTRNTSTCRRCFGPRTFALPGSPTHLMALASANSSPPPAAPLWPSAPMD